MEFKELSISLEGITEEQLEKLILHLNGWTLTLSRNIQVDIGQVDANKWLKKREDARKKEDDW